MKNPVLQYTRGAYQTSGQMNVGSLRIGRVRVGEGYRSSCLLLMGLLYRKGGESATVRWR